VYKIRTSIEKKKIDRAIQ